MTFVPHDRLSPGLWFLRTSYEPFYTVVSINLIVIGPYKDQLMVWSIDEEGYCDVECFGKEQFIGPVPPPYLGD